MDTFSYATIQTDSFRKIDRSCTAIYVPALLEALEVYSLGQITGRIQEIVGRFRPMV